MRRYLALGDSYTIGEGVASAERWPVRLAHRLNERGIPVRDPEIIARTGWTTDELASAIAAANFTGADSFDLVTLLIGVNDQYRGRPQAAFEAGFDGLLGSAIHLTGDDPERVVVVSIPDWGVTPFANGRDRAEIASHIDAFNASARARSERAGASWVDVTGSSRRMGRESALVVADGLHPSGAMYAEWSDLVLPAALRILARQ